MRTPRGRVVTRHAYKKFGLATQNEPVQSKQSDLFGGV